MSIPCTNDPSGYSCGRNPSSSQKQSQKQKTDAELWLTMMNSMLHFAMASTNLMKSIQGRMGICAAYKEEKKDIVNVADKIQEQLPVVSPDNLSEDFSLKTEPTRKDTCEGDTCNILYKAQEPKGDSCCCKEKARLSPTRIPVPIQKKKNSEDSVEKSDEAKTEETKPEGIDCSCVTEECKEDPCSCQEVTEAAKTDESPPCACSAQTEPDKGPPETRAASVGKDEESVNCSCQSEDDQEVESTNCECQTESTDDIMVKELQLANLAYQLRQTNENLNELKKEVNRISNFVAGNKRSPDEIAAALYQEIMKPRTSIMEVIGPATNLRAPTRRRHQDWL